MNHIIESPKERIHSCGFVTTYAWLRLTILLRRNRPGAFQLTAYALPVGMALTNFKKAAEGKPVAADADEIGKKMAELDQLAASGAPVEKQREAVNALKATVAATKAKL